MQSNPGSASAISRILVLAFCILLISAANLVGGEPIPQLGALLAIDPPGSASASAKSNFLLASNGAEGQLIWTERTGGGSSITNIFGSRVRADGSLVDPAGRFLFPQFTIGEDVYLLPVGSDFFLIFAQARNYPAERLHWLGMRLDAHGIPTVGPIKLSHLPPFNSLPPAPVFISTGRNILGLFALQQGVLAILTDPEGHELARRTNNTFSGFSRVATPMLMEDGDILLPASNTQFWRVNGSTAEITPLPINRGSADRTLTSAVLDSSRNELLLSFRLLVQDLTLLQTVNLQGELLSSASFADPYSPPFKVLPFKEGWLFFANKSSSLFSYYLQAKGSGFDIVTNPLPAIPFEQTFAPPQIEAWHDQGVLLLSEYTVGRPPQLAVWGNTGAINAQALSSVKNQEAASIVAGPNGYLALWEQRDALTNTLRVLRLGKDGMPRDAAPVTIGPVFSRAGVAPQGTFDGEHFVVAWMQSPGIVSIQTLAFDDPATNFPPTQVSVGAAALKFVRLREDLILVAKGLGGLRTFFIRPGNSIIYGPSLNGLDLASNGEELLMAAGQPARATFVGISNNIPMFGKTITLGNGVDPKVASVSKQFLVAWREFGGNIQAARIENGVSLTNRIAIAMPTTNSAFNLGSNERSYLISAIDVAPPYINQTNIIALIDATSGRISTNSQVVSFATNSVAIASAGSDFLTAMSLWKYPYHATATLQWISGTAPAQFDQPAVLDSQIDIKLSLDETRAYHIEESDDLIHWVPRSSVTGASQISIRESNDAENHFYRAVLDPD